MQLSPITTFGSNASPGGPAVVGDIRCSLEWGVSARVGGTVMHFRHVAGVGGRGTVDLQTYIPCCHLPRPGVFLSPPPTSGPEWSPRPIAAQPPIRRRLPYQSSDSAPDAPTSHPDGKLSGYDALGGCGFFHAGEITVPSSSASTQV